MTRQFGPRHPPPPNPHPFATALWQSANKGFFKSTKEIGRVTMIRRRGSISHNLLLLIQFETKLNMTLSANTTFACGDSQILLFATYWSLTSKTNLQKYLVYRLYKSIFYLPDFYFRLILAILYKTYRQIAVSKNSKKQNNIVIIISIVIDVDAI